MSVCVYKVVKIKILGCLLLINLRVFELPVEYIYTCITGPDGHRASSGGADDVGVESEGGGRHHETGGSVEAVRRPRRDRHEADAPGALQLCHNLPNQGRSGGTHEGRGGRRLLKDASKFQRRQSQSKTSSYVFSLRGFSFLTQFILDFSPGARP